MAPFSVLISDFAKNPNLCSAFFKAGTRIHPRERKMQRNGHRCHVATIWAEKTAKTLSFSFLI